MKSKPLTRCSWVNVDDPMYLKYHDEEWGVPVYDDRKIFEFLTLESFQAGLSWRIVLHKRANFEKAFANFDPQKVAKFTATKIKTLLNDPGIIRNRLKIRAAVANAKAFLAVQKEFRSFSKYMWSWVKNQPLQHRIKNLKDIPTVSPEAINWSKDLKKRGFKFLGPTVIYSHMQAVGMVNDHVQICFRYNLHQTQPKRRIKIKLSSN